VDLIVAVASWTATVAVGLGVFCAQPTGQSHRYFTRRRNVMATTASRCILPVWGHPNPEKLSIRHPQPFRGPHPERVALSHTLLWIEMLGRPRDWSVASPYTLHASS